MATLDAFLVRGKNKGQLTIQDVKVKHAFVNPFETVVKKPALPLKASSKPVKSQTKTIAHYFTPMDADVKMEETSSEACIIRHKMSVMDLWDVMQYEFDQDPFYSENFEQKEHTPAIPVSCGNRRRRRQSDAGQNVSHKRHKKLDNELSSIMTRFLTMGTVIKYKPTNLDFLNEFSEEIEDLSRQVRHKQTLQQSHLFIRSITQEFLF